MRVLRPRQKGEPWLSRLIWLLQSPIDFFAGPATPRPKTRVYVDEQGNVTPPPPPQVRRSSTSS